MLIKKLILKLSVLKYSYTFISTSNKNYKKTSCRTDLTDKTFLIICILHVSAAKGNSIFAEVEDKRQEMAKNLIQMKQTNSRVSDLSHIILLAKAHGYACMDYIFIPQEPYFF